MGSVQHEEPAQSLRSCHHEESFTPRQDIEQILDPSINIRTWFQSRYYILTNTSISVLLSDAIAKITTTFHHIVVYTQRTYRYLHATAQYGKRVRRDKKVAESTSKQCTIVGHTIFHQMPRKHEAHPPSISYTDLPSLSRREEFEIIASLAGLRPEEITHLALQLEDWARYAMSFKPFVLATPIRLAQNSWHWVVNRVEGTWMLCADVLHLSSRIKIVLAGIALWCYGFKNKIC